MTARVVVFLNVVGMMGGAEHSLLILLKGLDPNRYTPVLVCPADSPLAVAAEAHGINVIGTQIRINQLLKHPYAYLSSLTRLLRAIRAFSPSLIHGNGLQSTHYVVPLARILKIPSIIHVRDINIPPSRITRALLKRAAVQIAISRAVHCSMAHHKVLGRECHVIYNGVDPGPFQYALARRDAIRKSLGIDQTDVVVGLVGRVLPWKGHSYFVNAAALLTDVSTLKWIIVGEEWSAESESARGGSKYIDVLKSQIAGHDLGHRVMMIGARNDIPAIMAALDINIMPSVEPEPFGRVAIEAMAGSKPVIATQMGGLIEIVAHGKSGYLVPSQDAQAIADHVRELAGNPALRRNMGQVGLQIVQQKFTHHLYIQRVMNVYDTLNEHL